MSTRVFQTVPVQSNRMPPGIPFIVGNEAAERFSYYGMKAILMVYMTKYLLDADGSRAVMTEPDAKVVYHLFSAANYAIAILGALLADLWWGKYRTIIWLSLVYCLGHLALSLDETRIGLFVGLGLIAIGSGGIKPCVSAHVGDQFSSGNQHLLERVYGWFYFSINFGAFFSTMLTPFLLDDPRFGPAWAFGVPGVLMALATLTFWLGRFRYVHIPARGANFIRESLSPTGRSVLLRLGVIYLFIAVFWSLYDQTGSTWVAQAERMDRKWLGHEWSSSQIQAINPILIMIFIPLFTQVIYPLLGKLLVITPLGKMSVGFFFAVAAFALSGWIEVQLAAGRPVNISWQMIAFALMTTAEIMVYFTSLEFSYSQAPPTMKSVVMALNLLSVTVGNLFTSLINWLISLNEGFKRMLDGPGYHWFFTGLMLIAACLFVVTAWNYRGQTYLQDAGERPVDQPTSD